MENNIKLSKISDGEYYGYPKCCTKWWSTRRPINKENPITSYMSDHQIRMCLGSGLIICPTCANKMSSRGELKNLIKNRVCKLPFTYKDTIPQL